MNQTLVDNDIYTDLAPVMTPDGKAVWASGGDLYFGAIFGRDSLEVAEDVVEFSPKLTKKLLLTIASHQGLNYDLKSEEEVGKIHHEYRRRLDAKNDRSLEIFDNLTKHWGGDAETFTYYGSVDATPLFLRLIGKYISETGDDKILDEDIVGRDGNTRKFRAHAALAASWVVSKIEQSDIGFIEYKRFHDMGIQNQVWKDSVTSHIHRNRKLARFDDGIASLEVQCYAYDGLKAADRFLKGANLGEFIAELGQRIVNKFWIKEKRIFAMALDRSKSGRVRQIKVPSSNTGLILNSGVLVRAVEPVTGKEALESRRGVYGVNALNGPAKLTKALDIDKALNGHDLRYSPLKLVAGSLRVGELVVSSPRIGISKAKDVHRRYFIKDNPYVSR